MAVLDEALTRLQPTLVISLGLASGRSDITPERVAINIDDARIPDNAGKQPVDEAVVDKAPAAYFSTLPIKAMVRNLREAGIPAAVSNTAGTFVCNHVFYALMHRLARRAAPGVRGGFIHIPALPQQAAKIPGMASMALETQVKGMREAIRTAMTTKEDLRENAGQLH
jgi:pyroglutamyl-peptidase